MQFNKSILVLIVLFLPFLVVAKPISPKDGKHVINIYATNDLHGRFFDSTYIDKGVNQSSLSIVSKYLKNERANAKIDPILLELGDNLQGDNASFFYNYIDTTGRHILTEIVEYLKYDAVVVGNHDIETGGKVYNKLKNELSAPYLAANAIRTDNGKPYFLPYTIIIREGIRIAVIGLTNPNIPSWLTPSLWKGMEFKKIPETTSYWVNYINQNEKPHIIVVAMHAGIGIESDPNIEDPALYTASKIKGIDVVFAAHDHKVFNKKVYNGEDSVLVIEAGNRAQNISHVKITISIENDKVVDKSILGTVVNMSGLPADSDFNQQFRAKYLKVREFTNKKIGSITKDIYSRDAFAGPSLYIDLIHKIQLETTKADISFASPLNFDVKINKGDLNFQDLMNLYPFENQLYVMELTGQEIKNYLELSYDQWILAPVKPNSKRLFRIKYNIERKKYQFEHYFFSFDSAAGIIYEVNINKPKGEMINIKSMSNGESFDLKKTYKVAISSYRANGGGDLLEKGAGLDSNERTQRVIERMSDIRELVYQYFKKHPQVELETINSWKFVPENKAKQLIQTDFKLLFKNL